MLAIGIIGAVVIWFLCTKSKVEQSNEEVRQKFLKQDIIMREPPNSTGVAIGIMFFMIVGTFLFIALIVSVLGLPK